VLTKKEGDRVIKVWKEWHRRCGWTVQKNVATHPETLEMRAITLREYDSETRKRVEPSARKAPSAD
jgi:hypothetical protein